MSPPPIRVLVVDDSPVFAGAMRAVLESDADIRVVGVASDGHEAVRMVQALRPSVVTMDLEMPGIGGVGAIEQIMAAQPTAMVVVSSSRRVGERDFIREMRRLGVAAVIDKGEAFGGDFEAARRVAAVVREAAGRPVPQTTPRPPPPPLSEPVRAALTEAPRSLAVGLIASTGGPPALAGILAGLPERFRAPILVVQHLGVGFDDALLTWLGGVCPMPVVLATQGARVEAGRVYLAPHGRHTLVTAKHQILLRDPAELRRVDHVPSGNVMLTSLAEAFGRGAIGVALTGMGDDGVDGLRAIRDAGGLTIAQDGETATVDGIPGQARARGAAMQVLRLEAIADFLTRAVTRRSGKGARLPRRGAGEPR